ncbi:peroxiredoxin family protein [Mesorhizobium sp. ES1-3]|nr:peroxiredoxin family protein [Mesorhizobium sp. ES1-3]
MRAGDRAPDFTLTTHGGQPVSLTAELQKGPVMLSFLASMQLRDVDIQLAALSNCAGRLERRAGYFWRSRLPSCRGATRPGSSRAVRRLRCRGALWNFGARYLCHRRSCCH